MLPTPGLPAYLVAISGTESTTAQLARLKTTAGANGRSLQWMDSGHIGGVHDAIKLSDLAALETDMVDRFPLVRQYREIQSIVAGNKVEITRLEAQVVTEREQAEATAAAEVASKARRLKALESKLGLSTPELRELLGA